MFVKIGEILSMPVFGDVRSTKCLSLGKLQNVDIGSSLIKLAVMQTIVEGF